MLPRFTKSSVQAPAPDPRTKGWGTYVAYIEFADDRFPVRHIVEFENGNMLAYDRTRWMDEFGMLADFRFGNPWVDAWGYPAEIPGEDFEEKWCEALKRHPDVSHRSDTPPWLRLLAEGRFPEDPNDWPLRKAPAGR